MNSLLLQSLLRHTYRDGTYSYHYAPAEWNQPDALVDRDKAQPTNDPADRFTYWPPQPVIAWLDSHPNT